jgi:hypothetical protein
VLTEVEPTEWRPQSPTKKETGADKLPAAMLMRIRMPTLVTVPRRGMATRCVGRCGSSNNWRIEENNIKKGSDSTNN